MPSRTVKNALENVGMRSRPRLLDHGGRSVGKRCKEFASERMKTREKRDEKGIVRTIDRPSKIVYVGFRTIRVYRLFVHVCVWMNTYACVYVCVCVCVYIYLCIYVCMYT